MRKFTLLIMIITVFNSFGFSQCSTLITPNNITLNNFAGTCGAQVSYIQPFVSDTCSINFFEDFESGYSGWIKGAYTSVENWRIQNFTGTGTNLGSNMFGVPHSGNYAYGGAEHSYIQSPLFNTSGGGIISFDYFVNNEPAFHDKEIVEISYDGGGTWIQIFWDQLTNNALNVQSLSFNVSTNDGSPNTTLKFTYNTVDACCGAQDGFFIDNVKFEKETNVQQLSGLGSGATFPIGITTEIYEIIYDGITDTVSFDIHVVSINNTSQTISICNGESIAVGNHIYSETGIYVDSLATQFGCDSIVTTNLTVKNAIDTSLTITNNLIESNELNAIYQWIDVTNSSIINGATNREYLASTNGTYAVIINYEGCVETSSNVDLLSTDLTSETKNIDFNLRVYPNPTTDKVIVELNNDFPQSKISLVDITGKEIFTRNNILTNKTEIDLKPYATGVYFLRLFSNDSAEIVRIIKQ